ncbi:hypothetical protein BPO_0553 [Bergeyella porcorum]|uniref:Uncharacterized protein n=1 Tax=Bergeyella porcorum TaxID=1735111 RepID=A0AAU0F1L1_9FLAO
MEGYFFRYLSFWNNHLYTIKNKQNNHFKLLFKATFHSFFGDRFWKRYYLFPFPKVSMLKKQACFLGKPTVVLRKE